jgi:hypothetical protein
MTLIEKKIYSEKELLDKLIKKKIEIELLKELGQNNNKSKEDFEFYKKRYNEVMGKK